LVTARAAFSKPVAQVSPFPDNTLKHDLALAQRSAAFKQGAFHGGSNLRIVIVRLGA